MTVPSLDEYMAWRRRFRPKWHVYKGKDCWIVRPPANLSISSADRTAIFYDWRLALDYAVKASHA